MDLPPPVTPVPPPTEGGPRRLARATLVGAWTSLVLFGVAGLLLVIPVRVPEVQECGTVASYLLRGPVDVMPTEDGRFLDEQGEVVSVDEDVARDARDRPCRDRVADLAVPAAIALVTATVIGLASVAVELFVVRPRQRRAIRAATAATAAADDGSDEGDGGSD